MIEAMWVITLMFVVAICVLSVKWVLPKPKQGEYGGSRYGEIQRAHEEAMALHNWGGGTRTSRNLR